MKQFRKILLVLGLMLSSIILISCSNDETTVLDEAYDALTYEIILHQDDQKDAVKNNLNLFSNDGDVEITWESSNIDVITNVGVVNRTSTNSNVTLTATLELNSDKRTKTFELIVLSLEENITTEFKVTFNTDGGSDVDEQIVAEGLKANEPANPTKDGYTFIGWFIEDQKFNFNTTITKNLTLMAKWEVNEETTPNDKTTIIAKYPEGETTKFSSNSNDNNASLIGLDPKVFEVMGTVIVMPNYSNPIGLNKDGSIRLYSNRDNGEGNTLTVSVAEGIEIQGLKFVFGEHTSPATDAELILGEKKETLNSYQIVNTTLERKDLNINTFSIQNKYQAESGSNQLWILSIEITYLIVGQTPTEPKTEFTVTFDTDGESEVNLQSVEENALAIKPETPIKEGYTFLGWFLGDVVFDFDTPITKDINVLAKWEVIEDDEEPSESADEIFEISINSSGERIQTEIDSGDITKNLTINNTDEVNISVEYVKGTGANTIFNNSAGEIRLYVDGELNIKVGEDFEIVSLEFNTSRNNGVLVNDLEFTDQDVNVFFDNSVNEVNIKANGSQVRIDTITITYKVK